MTFFYTAKNHRGYVNAAIAKAERELAELDQRERNLIRHDGMPRHTPLEEQERRQAIAQRRQEVTAERAKAIETAFEVARDAATSARQRIAAIAARQANPIVRLSAAEAANVQQLVFLLEAGFRRSDQKDVLAQIRAAVTDGSRDQRVACLELVQRQANASRGSDHLTYVALANELLAKLQDPELARLAADLEQDVNDAQQLIDDVSEQARPFQILAEQERLVASGNYGSVVGSGRPLRNFNEAPVHEMVEQG